MEFGFEDFNIETLDELKNIYDQCEKRSTKKINDVKKLLQLDRYRNPELD